ncbi:unnamed protein product [Sympodiomycopsis kandeliae]
MLISAVQYATRRSDSIAVAVAVAAALAARPRSLTGRILLTNTPVSIRSSNTTTTTTTNRGYPSSKRSNVSGTRTFSICLPGQQHASEDHLVAGGQTLTPSDLAASRYVLPDVALQAQHDITSTSELHPIEQSILAKEPSNVTWELYQALLSQGEQIPIHAVHQLWWKIARDIQMPRNSGTVHPDLARLGEIVTRHGQNASSSSYRRLMDTFKLHRWLYLLCVQLEQNGPLERLHDKGTLSRRTGVTFAHVYTLITEAIQYMRSQHQIIDETLMLKLAQVLTTSGKQLESLTIWQEQQHIRHSTSMSPLKPTSKVVELWLDTLAHSSLPSSLINEWSLKLITIAIQDKMVIHKRVLDSWMSATLNQESLIYMLPADMVVAMNKQQAKYPWVQHFIHLNGRQPSAVADVIDPVLQEHLTEDHKHVLCEVTAFQLCKRGEISAALALHEMHNGMKGRLPVSWDIRTILLRSLSKGSEALLKRNDIQAAREVLNCALQVYSDHRRFVMQRKRDGDSLGNSSINSHIKSDNQEGDAPLLLATNSIIDAASMVISRDYSQSHTIARKLWLTPLRRLTSSILASDPLLSHKTIHDTRLTALAGVHALLQDYTLTKEIWIKWQRLEAQRDLDGIVGRGGGLPLFGLSFAWFLQTTLERPSQRDVMFGLEIFHNWLTYQDWEHKNADPNKTLPTWLLVKLIQRLSSFGKYSQIGTLIANMAAHPSSAFLISPQVVRVLSSAFRHADSFSIQQSILIIDSLVELLSFQEESERRRLQAERADDLYKPNLTYPKPLEIFTYPLTSITSVYFCREWSQKWFNESMVLFEKFVSHLEKQLQSRNFDTVSGSLVQSSVRTAWNSIAKAILEAPVLPLFRCQVRELDRGANLEEQTDRNEVEQPGHVEATDVSSIRSSSWDDLIGDAVHNTDLVPSVAQPSPQVSGDDSSPAQQTSLSSSAAPAAAPSSLSPFALGDSRRSAVLHLLSILEGQLSTQGDWETWSVKILCWMLPSQQYTWEHRKKEILNIWEESLMAEYDANKRTEIKPWVRFAAADLHDTGAQTRRGDHSGVQAVNSSYAKMRPILIRPSLIARFILNLSMEKDYTTCDLIYDSSMSRIKEVQEQYHHSLSESPSPKSRQNTVSEYRSLLWEVYTVTNPKGSRHISKFDDLLSDGTKLIQKARVVDLLHRGTKDCERQAHQLWKECERAEFRGKARWEVLKRYVQKRKVAAEATAWTDGEQSDEAVNEKKKMEKER